MVGGHVFFLACSRVLEVADHCFDVVHCLFIFYLFLLTLSFLDHAKHHMFFVLVDQLSHVPCNVFVLCLSVFVTFFKILMFFFPG